MKKILLGSILLLLFTACVHVQPVSQYVLSSKDSAMLELLVVQDSARVTLHCIDSTLHSVSYDSMSQKYVDSALVVLHKNVILMDTLAKKATVDGNY